MSDLTGMSTLEQLMHQTDEDKAINIRLAKRLRTWGFLDSTLPSNQHRSDEYANVYAGARVGFVTWSEVIDPVTRDAMFNDTRF